MKRITALLLALIICLSLVSCAGKDPEGGNTSPDSTEMHKIGVIVYNTADEEVIGFREYLQGYIESNFEMVKFVYSGSLTSTEQVQEFISSASKDGVEGFMSFVTYDLKKEFEVCEKNKVFYMLASGTVSDEEFDAVADSPYFLGMFGPGQPFEFQAGADMARFFTNRKVGTHYFILSGGASLGNEMHYQRTLGILDAFASSYGVHFPMNREDMAKADKPLTVETPKLTVTICPGYISLDNYLAQAADCFRSGSFDAVLSVLPIEEMVSVIGKTPFGIVDSYNTRNLQLFTSNGSLKYVVGKYSSLVGPAFALMLNAVTGHGDEFRENGKAIKVTQGFWTADSPEDYLDKYTLSSSAALNAYNFEDLSKVIRIFNKDANINDLVALAEACSYRAVLARRGQ